MLEIASMMLKYGPWKDTLLQFWGNSQQGSGVRCPEERARRLHSVLMTVVRKMNNMCVDDEWASSVGNNVSHRSGPLAILQKWSVITKDHQGHVVVGKCKQRYRIARKSDKKVLKILARYIQVVDFWAQVGVLHCLADWEQEVTSLAVKIKESRVPCFSGDYGLRWSLRTS